MSGAGAEALDSAPATTIACLLCGVCRWPLIAKSDIIIDRAEVWATSVYSYELELLGENTWVYSATNPAANRFDVLRCGASAGTAIAHEKRRFSGEHTWFPGYEWSMASCCSCGEHLGWAFSLQRGMQQEAHPTEASNSGNSEEETERETDVSNEETESDVDEEESELNEDPERAEEPSPRPVNFFGVIVTKCVAAEDYSSTEFFEAMESAEQRRSVLRQRTTLLRQLFARLNVMENRVAANRITALLSQLDARGELSISMLSNLVSAVEEVTNDPLLTDQPE
jgi:hypothetical protein